MIPGLLADQHLDSAERDKWQTLSTRLCTQLTWRAAQGFKLSKMGQKIIAQQMAQPLINLPEHYFAHWDEIVIYAESQALEQHHKQYYESDQVAAADAYSLRGPIALSWADVLEAEAGYVAAIHEVAHLLDAQSGICDGFPPLHAQMAQSDWEAAFQQAFEDVHSRLDRAEQQAKAQGGEPDEFYEHWLDPYAANAPAEFFAVLSECFFSQPAEVRRDYPQVYAQLCAFYRQSPQ